MRKNFYSYNKSKICNQNICKCELKYIYICIYMYMCTMKRQYVACVGIWYIKEHETTCGLIGVSLNFFFSFLSLTRRDDDSFVLFFIFFCL